MAGYSGTPLLKKLGIKPGYKIIIINEPAAYWGWLAPLPEGTDSNAKKGEVDFIHLFVKEKKTFEKEFLKNKNFLKKEGMLWISWQRTVMIRSSVQGP